MKRFVLALGLLILATCPGLAQSAARSLPLVGILVLYSPSPTLPPEYHKLLAEKGLREGRNIRLSFLNARGDGRRLDEMARELVSENPAVIVAISGNATRAAQQATRTIPIIAAAALLEDGFVDSLARPSGNITGVSIFAGELDPKRLQLLRDMIPSTQRVAVLGFPAFRWTMPWRNQMQTAAAQLGLVIASTYSAFGAADIDTAFETFAASDATALITLANPQFAENAEAIGRLSARYRLPAICHERRMAIAGCLASYSYDGREIDAIIVDYVARILAGVSPGELPVVRPTRFELFINLLTAKALGLTIPPSIMLQATEVIE